MVDVPDDGIDQDCDRRDAVDLDRDRDQFTRPKDCRDDRKDINPGAIEVPGNGVDEDCDHEDAPFPAIASTVTLSVASAGRHFKVVDLSVLEALRGTTIGLRCRGSGCGLKNISRRLTRSRSRIDLTKSVRKLRLRPRTSFEVRLTKPGYVGKVVRWKTRRKLSQGLARTNLCLDPGARRAERCEL